MSVKASEPNTKRSAQSNVLMPLLNSQNWKDKIKNLFCGKSSYLWLSFIIPSVIMYLIYLAMEIHPFGDGSVLVLDLNAQYVYFYEALHEFVWGDASLLYSFSRQLGGEYMGIYAYYVASPFSYIVALFPKTMVLEALLCIFLLKTGLCGFTCGWYLSKITPADKLKKNNIIVFSCMYALCSYAIVHQSNSMWIDALIWLPVLTYSIEQLIKYRKFKLFVISLSFTMMSNYYIGYMACIYVALYFFYYYIAHSQDNANNPWREKTHFAKSLLRILLYSILGLGISAVIIFTAYYSLSFGKNTFSNPSWEFKLKFDIMDYLTKFLPGSYDTVRRKGLPFVYCGTLTLFMLPIYFISSKRTNREKIMSGVMIAVFSLCFMINIVDLVWHGFQEPNWLNYRYSFMLSFLLLVMAYKGFCDMDNISSKVHMTTAAILTLFIVVAQKYTFESYNKEKGAPLDAIQTIAFSLLCIAVYLIIISVYKNSGNKKQSMGILLTIVVCIELFANGLSNVVGFDKDVIYSSYSSYHDFMDKIRPTVDAVIEKDPSFYRMEKINHRRTNDNMALNIRGLSNSSSTLNKETVSFLSNMGYSSAAHKSIYKGGNIVNDSLLGLRYIIAPKEDSDEKKITEEDNLKIYLDEAYDLFMSDENYNVYFNPYALSIAFAVDSSVADFNFKDENDKAIYFTPYEKINAVISSMLGSSDGVEMFKPIDDYDIATSNSSVSSIDKHNKYVPKDSNAAATVTYSFTATRDGYVYFYLPSLYPREVELTLNGQSYGTFYGDDTSRSLLLGYFEEGDEIKLAMKLKSTVLYVKNKVAAFYYLDEEVFKNCFNTLSQTQLVIDDEYKEDHLKGTINTLAENQTIQTTIPYDEGWIVKIDGKRVDTYKTFDSLIAFDISESGEHTVDIIYRSDAFVYGMTITVISVALFAVLIIFEKKIFEFIYTKIYSEKPCNTEKENLLEESDETSNIKN